MFVTFVAIWLVTASAHASVLVIAPHPDDDILAAAGVVHRALGHEEVTVVFMTNGDATSIAQGLLRQDEAVAGQVQQLGNSEDNLIFLGYPNGHLQEIYDNYTDPSSQFFTAFGQGVTYGERGLGRMDYHSYRFGSPAAYNRPNIVTDLAEILATYRPRQIFTPAEFDRHTDHATSYRLLRMALDAVHASDASYAPVVNRTIIWTPTYSHWPTLSDPVGYHTTMPYLSQTMFSWNDRASLDVPLPMQDTNLLTNLKYKAIQAHASEFDKYDGFLPKWAHKDEIFWPENPFGSNRPPIVEAGADVFSQPGAYAQLDGSGSRDPEGSALSYHWTQRAGTPVTLQNAASATPGFVIPGTASPDDSWTFQLVVSDGIRESAADMVHVFSGTRRLNIAPQATVTASSQDISTGQLASRAVDGIADGAPGDAMREWVTLGQTAGAWIRLTWSALYRVDRVVLYDRPNMNDRVTAGTLSFSDGSTVPVSALSNGGAPVEIRFPARTVSSLTFTITAVSGTSTNIGLAEIRAYAESMTRPPVLTNPGNQIGTVGVAVNLQLAAFDADGDTLTYSASGLPYGLSINSSMGRITGTPTAAGTFNVSVTVNDGRGGSDTETFTWTVAPANVAPVLTNPGAQDGIVGEVVNLQVTATDADGDTLGYAATGLPAGLTINTSTGRISGTPTAAGTFNVSVTVNDGRGGSDTETFTWTVAPANVAPVLTNPGAQDGIVGEVVNLQVTATDADGDTLGYAATGLPAGLTINTSTGRISGTPTAAGTFNVSVTVNDGRGGSDTETFTWTVAQANVAPVLTNPGNQSGTVGTALSLQLGASDADGDTLGYAAVGLPAGLTINTSTGRISGTPITPGTSNVTIAVSDGRGGSDTDSFNWTIAPANIPPVVTNPGNQSGIVGTAVSLQIAATDANGDILTYNASGLPAGLSINAATGRISGMPNSIGSANVNVTVNDGRGGSDSTAFTWSVLPAPPVNVAPVLTNPGSQTGTVGEAVSLQILASDANGDSLGYSAGNLPAGLAIDTSTGRISGVTTTAGSSSVTIVVSDGRGGSDTATFTWTVVTTNVAPTLTNPGPQSGTVGAALALALVATDADGDALTFAAGGLPLFLKHVPILRCRGAVSWHGSWRYATN
jgi:LmbE family N-acetylglucosaminyl deacetylase